MIAYNFNEDSPHADVVWVLWYAADSAHALGPDYAVTYAYDEYDRFSTVAVSNGPTFTYTYLPGTSLLAGYTNTLGLSVAYEYEPHRDLKTLVFNAWSTNPISTFAYTYDAIDRRIQRVDSGLTTNVFDYNTRSELINAVMGTNTYSYAYDPIGNRTESVENGLTTTYAANELNQYTTLNPGAPNSTPFSYDADGNMTSDGRFLYMWNGENRMAVASNDEVVVTYAYDYQGRMVNKKISREGGEEQSISYNWDNWNIIRETLATNNTPQTTHNVWGLDLDGTLQGVGGVGGLLVVIRDCRPYFSTYDANGNVAKYVSWRGEIMAYYDYSPFGVPVIVSGLLASTFSHQFSTKPNCAFTGVSEYQLRKYRAEIGRWSSRDPIGGRSGLNSYGFVGNVPIILIDKFGLKYENPISRPSVPIGPRFPSEPDGAYGSGPGMCVCSERPEFLDAAVALYNEWLNAWMELKKAKDEMKRANVKRSDKYFHCLGSCNAARAGSRRAADMLGRFRELEELARQRVLWHLKRYDIEFECLPVKQIQDPDAHQTRDLLPVEHAQDSIEDYEANKTGFDCPLEKTCEECCCKYKVNGL